MWPRWVSERFHTWTVWFASIKPCCWPNSHWVSTGRSICASEVSVASVQVCGDSLVTMVPQRCTWGFSLIDDSRTQSQLRRVGLPSYSALSAGSLGPSARKSGLQHNNTNNAYMQVFVGELLVMTESKNKHIRSSEVHKMFCQSSQRVSWISRHLSARKTSCVPPVRHLIVNKRNVRTRDDIIRYLVLSQPTYRVLQL